MKPSLRSLPTSLFAATQQPNELQTERKMKNWQSSERRMRGFENERKVKENERKVKENEAKSKKEEVL